MLRISAADVRAAAARLAGAIEQTPCLPSRTLSQLTGAQVFLKFENLQFTASFKERGALNKLLSLGAEERRRGVIAMSAGNHAQAVAYHAARLGMPAVIVMPKGSPNTKVRNTQVHGAKVVLEGANLFDAGRHARELAARDNLVFVHPYEDALVIAGQGTVGLEMLEAVPDLDVLVVPVGGGGLVSGMAIVAKAMRKDISIFGVETQNYPSMYQRLRNLPIECGGDTIAEGIAVKDVGDTAFGIIKELVEEVLVVKEETIERAVAALIEIEKTVAEGAGAAALAALLEQPGRFAGKRVGLPITGGNIDTRVLASVLMRGLVRDARLVRLRVTMPDISGSLARVAALIAEAGGNIVEVQHQRVFGTASVKSTEIEFLIETRERAHTEALVRALETNGLKTTLV
ncbi:MAG TPA: threonine ammonia-lyase [Burkholderiales bacterium]|jgi:threonine dehydratase|nr:threonine ammonia-lyase [Burkholderiales bacterium]